MDNVKQMLGTFSPQQEAYTYDIPEETTPSGYFARGSYSAKTKVISNEYFYLSFIKSSLQNLLESLLWLRNSV